MRLHQAQKAVEEKGRVVRARRSLRVVLDREDRASSVTESLDTAVVQIAVTDLEIRILRKSRSVEREAVILRDDQHPSALLVAGGLIRPVVAEAKLRASAAEREAQEAYVEESCDSLEAPGARSADPATRSRRAVDRLTAPRRKGLAQ